MKRTTTNTQREITFSLYQRFCLATLLSRQTFDSIKKSIGREVVEDDAVALFSVRRKVRPAMTDLAPFTRRFGNDTTIDLTAMSEIQNLFELTVSLDSGEARLLKAFLSGWLKIEGSLADRDWTDGIMEACGL